MPFRFHPVFASVVVNPENGGVEEASLAGLSPNWHGWTEEALFAIARKEGFQFGH